MPGEKKQDEKDMRSMLRTICGVSSKTENCDEHVVDVELE